LTVFEIVEKCANCLWDCFFNFFLAAYHVSVSRNFCVSRQNPTNSLA